MMNFSGWPIITWDDLNHKQQKFLTTVADQFPAWVKIYTARISDRLNPVEYAFMKEHRLIAVDGPFICCTPTGLTVYNTRVIWDVRKVNNE